MVGLIISSIGAVIIYSQSTTIELTFLSTDQTYVTGKQFSNQH